MLATECPPRENLKSYLHGKLNEEDSAVLEKHLLECENCDRVAGELEQEPDSFVEAIQADSADDSRSEGYEQAFTDAIELIHYNPPEILRRNLPSGSVGSYDLLEQLGRGGMGSVYLARHRELDKRVAIKLLPALSAQREEVVARFRREIKAAGRLEHPAIVRATDAGQADGTHYLVMEAIDGMDVSRTARLVGRLGVADACKIVREAALGLSYAHGEGIVHRDIKPSNLMLDVDGRVKILDFGLALMNLWDEGTAELTTVGQLMGTLDYMAPEQAERSGAVDYRADLYSLGATLFRLLAGRPPLAASPHLAPLEKLRMLAEHSPPRIDTLRDDVPRELVQLLTEMLARDPNRRPASAAHVAERLEPFTESANLALLVSTARAAADRDSGKSNANFASDLPDFRTPKLLAANSSRRGSKFAIWVAAVLVPLLVLGGILLVVETSKGQLVIQSEADNVHIKVVQGETPVQELQIHPGTQVTRLRGGKYEILIDSPSDKFSISNNHFTIHRGDTIVATITPKGSTQAVDPASEIKRVDKPNEPVYEGKSLEEWLAILRFERTLQESQKAFSAVRALASPEHRDSVLPIVSGLIVSPPNHIVSTSNKQQVLGILAAIGKKDFFWTLCNIFDRCTAATQMQWIQSDYSNISVQTLEEIEPLLVWTDKVMSHEKTTPDYSLVIGIMLRQFLHQGGANAGSPICRRKVLEHLKSYRQLADMNYWLYFPEPEGSRPSRSLEFPWSEELRSETLQRVYEILVDPTSDPVRVSCAAMIAASTRPHGGQFSDDQKRKLVGALRVRLSKFSEERESPSTASVPATLEQFAGPSFEAYSWRSVGWAPVGTIVVSEKIAILNFIKAFQFAQDLMSELEAVHASFAPTAEQRTISDTDLLQLIQVGKPARSAVPWSQFVKKLVSSNKLHGTIQYFIYFQTGQLLGKDVSQLVHSTLGQAATTPTILVQPGDTLAIYVERVLPMFPGNSVLAPPVIQAGTKPPVWGLPVPVTNSGEIVLPLIGPLKVESLSLDQVRDLIRKAYINNRVLKEDEFSRVTVSVSLLLKAGEQLEVRNVTGQQPTEPQKEDRKN